MRGIGGFAAGDDLQLLSLLHREDTPKTSPESFVNVRGCPGKMHVKTKEIWEKDRLHEDHYEVHKNLKEYEKSKRDRSVWDDGRRKESL